MTIEKRNLRDRRAKSTSPIGRFFILGRRKRSRRVADSENYYVDKYESRYLVLILAILILCVLDVYFTLKILQLGGNELNPFMSFLIKKNPALSLVVKYLVTAGGLVILLIHKNFKIFGKLKVHSLIYFIFFLYFILMLYEILFFIQMAL